MAERVATRDPKQAIPFDWGSIEWLVNAERLPDSRMTFGFVEIQPGAKNMRHYHPNCDEVLFLLEGEIDHRIGEEIYHLTPGTAIHIPQGVPHDARNRGATVARMVVAYSDGNRETVTCDE